MRNACSIRELCKSNITQKNMKKQLQLVAALLCFSTVSLFAQVNVTGGASATYSTVNAAFAAINSGIHTGAITIDITASTTEPSTPTPLLASGQSSANYTSIIMRPMVTATISGVMLTGRGVLEFDGADNFTIDGDIVGGPVTRDLTISNDAAMNIAATAAIRFIGRTTGGLGATNNTVMNCIIYGNTQGNDGASGSTVTNSYGIYAGNNAVNLTSAGTGDNYDNLTIQNNEFKRSYYGLYIGGTTAGVSDNAMISGNIFGSSTVGSTLSYRGLMLTTAANATVSQNQIFNLKVSTSVSNAGIEISGTSSSAVNISQNKIYSVWSTSTGGWGAYGISLIGGNNHLLTNNVIYDILTTNYNSVSTTFQAFGIRITSGTGHRIYYNSINLYGSPTGGSTTNCYSSAFMVSSTAVTGIDVRNNVFSNKMTSTVTTPKFYATWFPASYNFMNATLNNNAYMVTNDAAHFVGRIGTTATTGDFSNLAAWQATVQATNAADEVSSVPPVNGNAPFVADNDLNIPANSITPIESGAVLIPALGTNIDYNSAVRPLAGVNPNTNPDIGAYEFDGLPGVATDAGIQTLTSPATNGCYGASENLVVTIKNYGTASISNIPVTVVVSGAVIQTSNATYSGTIAAGGTASFTVGTLNMLTAGVYTFNASTSLPGDLNAPNDAMAQTTRTVIPPVAIPQSVSFTGFTGSNLPTMFPNWYESAGVTVPSGTTSSWTSQTGLNGAGNITARINLVAISRNEWIVGPKFSATSGSQISFDAAVTDLSSIVNPDVMGSDDKVRLMVSTDCGVSYTPVYTISATNSLSTTFTNFNVSLGAYAGQDIIVAFLATDGPVDDIESYDFHLDNINLYNAAATDAGVSLMTAPITGTCYSGNENVVVTLNNYGTSPISNIPVSVIISGPINQTLTAVYPGPLAPSSNTSFTVGTANMSMGGIYSFSANTTMPGDPNAFNDATTATRTVAPVITIAGSTALCSGGSGTLTAMGPATSYLWSTSATTNSIVISPTATTVYSVVGTDVMTCTTAIQVTVSVTNPTITATGDTYCGVSGTGTLNASAFASVNWYASPTSTVSLSSGNTYVPPVAASTTTYYAEAQSIASGSIQTLFSGGNSCGGGNMFDITPTAGAIQIDSLDVNTTVGASSTFTVILFYKTGNYLGNETNSAAWTAWDTIVVTSAGSGNPSRVVLATPLFLPAATHALFVNFPASYTNGTNAYTNADVTLQMGAGLCSQFGGVNAGRMFNGNIYYTKPGCTSPRIPVVLTIAPNPTVMASSSSSTLCSGASATLTASGAATYTWSNGANTAATVVTPTANVTYTVIGDNSGCTDSTSLSITVGTNPTVTAVANPSVLCTGSTGTINASGATSYTWSTGAISTGIIITPTITTTYTVTGEDPVGCTGTSMITVTVSTCTGIDNTIAQNNGIMMYPNPAKEYISLYVSGVSDNLKLEVYDAIGKKVLTRTIDKINTQINIAELPDGIYVYRVTENSSTIKQGKFIKE
jgi:trimeric autotransporter adhesin